MDSAIEVFSLRGKFLLCPMGAWLGKFHCYWEPVLGEVWNLVDFASLFRDYKMPTAPSKQACISSS